MARLLAAPAGMRQQPRCRSLPEPGHGLASIVPPVPCWPGSREPAIPAPCADYRRHLCVWQGQHGSTPASGSRSTAGGPRTAPLPGPVAAQADLQGLAPLRPCECLACASIQATFTVHPSRNAVAFFLISSSRLSRMCSARSRESSLSCGVTAVPPAPRNLPAAAVLTQWRKVCSTRLVPSPLPPGPARSSPA